MWDRKIKENSSELIWLEHARMGTLMWKSVPFHSKPNSIPSFIWKILDITGQLLSVQMVNFRQRCHMSHPCLNWLKFYSRFGLVNMLNLDLNPGLVQCGSGLNYSSELNHGNPSEQMSQHTPALLLNVDLSVSFWTHSHHSKVFQFYAYFHSKRLEKSFWKVNP